MTTKIIELIITFIIGVGLGSVGFWVIGSQKMVEKDAMIDALEGQNRMLRKMTFNEEEE
jgi:hypothetical protein